MCVRYSLKTENMKNQSHFGYFMSAILGAILKTKMVVIDVLIVEQLCTVLMNVVGESMMTIRVIHVQDLK